MENIKRPGIAKQWQTGWSQVEKYVLQMRTTFKSECDELEHYADHGDTVTQPMLPPSIVTPARQEWENSFMEGALRVYGTQRFAEAEIAGIHSAKWPVVEMMEGFAAKYLEQLIAHYNYSVFPLRFEQRKLTNPDSAFTLHSALGMVIGCTEESLNLAKIQLAARRNDWYSDAEYYPIFHFILRLFADYLAAPEPGVVGSEMSLKPVNALFNCWRTPDPTELLQACLPVCDIHTIRSGYEEIHGQFFEFTIFKRIPVEILLVFKLRELIGLENPVIDHPLMNTAFGKLPEKVAFNPDPLITRVREKMIAQGFDENRIIADLTRI